MDPTFALLKVLPEVTTETINTLLFSDNGKYLLIAGDSEKVYVWNIETFQCEQILEDADWAQVTCMAWIHQDSPSREIKTTLCVCNGRGSISLYPMDAREVKPFSQPPTRLCPFEFNDPVEKVAFDKLNHRLAVASHSGKLKMYNAATVPLALLWEERIGDTISSGLFFYGGANQSLLTAGLESSELCCRNAVDSTLSWSKPILGGIGSAAMTSDETLMLVNNMISGNFDVYNVSEESPLRSLPIGSRSKYIKQCCFFEGSKSVVCGSDTNKIYIVDAIQNYVVQTLVTGQEQNMSGVVAATPASSRRVMIAAASLGSVYLWEKGEHRSSVQGVSNFRRLIKAFFRYDLHIFLLVLCLTFGAWYPYYCKFVGYLAMPVWPSGGNHMSVPSQMSAPVQSYIVIHSSVVAQSSVTMYPPASVQTFVATKPSVTTELPIAETPASVQTSVGAVHTNMVVYL